MRNILEQLEDMDTSTLLELWNEYQQNQGYEEELFNMCDFECLVDTSDFFATYEKIDHDNFNSCDDYFYFDRCGWICSTSDPLDLIDLDDLACYIEDNFEDFEEYFENV